jgi:hypothetical protein
MKKSLLVISTAAALALGACGGSDAPVASTLSGTAAVGLPIVGGAVNVTCAAGNALNTSTSSTGGWQVTVSGQTLPCAIQVANGKVNGVDQSGPYHSIAVTFGVVNITPLTDLIVANLSAQAPSAWFSGLNGAALRSIDQSAVNAAATKINSALGLTTTLAGSNPLTTSFSPVNGNLLDDILEALGKAGVNHASLLTLAKASNFTVPEGFNFQTAYAGIQAANGGTTGGGTSPTCTSTETLLTFGSSTTGSPYTNGQKLCVTASATSLAISGKTLSNPTPNTVVSLPFSAYKFADGAYSYEVIFNAGALHEINLVGGTNSFYGQFTPSSTTTPTTGTSSLTVAVAISGVASASFDVPNIPMPVTQAEFCGGIQNDSTFSQISAQGGGTLTIDSCTFANKVGTLSATLAITSPVSMTLPYTVTYTYR